MSDSKQVDVLAVLDDHAAGIEQAHKLARRPSERDEIAKGLCEFRDVRAVMAELIYAAATYEEAVRVFGVTTPSAFRAYSRLCAALAACAPAKGDAP